MKRAAFLVISLVVIACSKPAPRGPTQVEQETPETKAPDVEPPPAASDASAASEGPATDTAEPANEEGTATCETDADCSTCQGPQCSCMLAPESGKCPVPRERCFADPCMRKEARCDPDAKVCVLVDKPAK